MLRENLANRPSGAAYPFQESLSAWTQEKILPLLGIQDEPGLLPGRTLGQSLSQPICCLLSSWPWAGGRNAGGQEGNASPGQGRAGATAGAPRGPWGLRQGLQSLSLGLLFYTGLGECCLERAGHAPARTCTPSATSDGAPLPCGSRSREALFGMASPQPSRLPPTLRCYDNLPRASLGDSAGCTQCRGLLTWGPPHGPGHGPLIPGCCSLCPASDKAPRCLSSCEHFLNSFLQL